jgi:hypothetical protein
MDDREDEEGGWNVYSGDRNVWAVSVTEDSNCKANEAETAGLTM